MNYSSNKEESFFKPNSFEDYLDKVGQNKAHMYEFSNAYNPNSLMAWISGFNKPSYS